MSERYGGWGDPNQAYAAAPSSSGWGAAAAEPPALSSLSLGSSSSTSSSVPYGRVLQRAMELNTRDLPMTGSPKVRMRKLPPIPEPAPSNGSDGAVELDNKGRTFVDLPGNSPLVERFARQTASSPGPEVGWRMRGVLKEMGGSGGEASEQQQQRTLTEADQALITEAERRRREMDELLRSVQDHPRGVERDGEEAVRPAGEWQPTETELTQAQAQVNEQENEQQNENEDEEAIERRREWMKEHEKAWSIERYEQRVQEKAQRIAEAHEGHVEGGGQQLASGAVGGEGEGVGLGLGLEEIREDEEEEDREKEEEERTEERIMRRRSRGMVEDEGEEGSATERTEEEELKDEIEQSMKNDKEKIKEQMENLKRYQASASQKAVPGCFSARRRSGIFLLHQKKTETGLKDKDMQDELNRLLAFLKNMKVETLANSQSRKVIAMSGGLNIPQAYDFMERHGISSAPVYDEEGRTVGTIDSSDLMAFILISERPSLLQEVLRSNYDKDPFTKPVSAMIGASGRNQFTMVRAADTGYSLLQVFSLGRPSACVLDHEDMISWVVSQSSLIAFVEEYLNTAGVNLGKALAGDMNVIVSKLPFVRENVKAGDAFVSLCIHQAQAAAVIDEKRHFIAEISPRCFRGLTRFNSADFYLPIGQYMAQVHKASAWADAVTCRASITLRELLHLMVSRKAHRVWVVEGRKNKVMGLITLTSIVRSLLGVGCLYDQKPPAQGKLGPVYFDITNPDHWPHLRNK